MRKNNFRSIKCHYGTTEFAAAATDPEADTQLFKRTPPKVVKQRFKKKRVLCDVLDEKHAQLQCTIDHMAPEKKHYNSNDKETPNENADTYILSSAATAAVTEQPIAGTTVQKNENSDRNPTTEQPTLNNLVCDREAKKQKHVNYNNNSLTSANAVSEQKQALLSKEFLAENVNKTQQTPVKRESRAGDCNKIAPSSLHQRVLPQPKTLSYMPPRHDFIACGAPRFFVLDNHAYDASSTVVSTNSGGGDPENPPAHRKFLVPIYGGGLQPHQYIMDSCSPQFSNGSQLPSNPRSSPTPSAAAAPVKNSSLANAVALSEKTSVETANHPAGNAYVADKGYSSEDLHSNSSHSIVAGAQHHVSSVKTANELFLEQQQQCLYTAYLQPLASSYGAVAPPPGLVDFSMQQQQHRSFSNHPPSYTPSSSTGRLAGPPYLPSFQEVVPASVFPGSIPDLAAAGAGGSKQKDSGIQRKKKQKKSATLGEKPAATSKSEISFEEVSSNSSFPKASSTLDSVLDQTFVKLLSNSSSEKNPLFYPPALEMYKGSNLTVPPPPKKLVADYNQQQQQQEAAEESSINKGAVQVGNQKNNEIANNNSSSQSFPPQQIIRPIEYAQQNNSVSFSSSTSQELNSSVQTRPLNTTIAYYSLKAKSSAAAAAAADDKSKRQQQHHNNLVKNPKHVKGQYSVEASKKLVFKENNSNNVGYYEDYSVVDNKDFLKNPTAAFWSGGILVTDAPLSSESKVEQSFYGNSEKAVSSQQVCCQGSEITFIQKSNNEPSSNIKSSFEFPFESSSNNVFGYSLFEDTKQNNVKSLSGGSNNDYLMTPQQNSNQWTLSKKHVDDLWLARGDVVSEDGNNGISFFNGWTEPCFSKGGGGGTWLSVPFV